MKKERKSAEIPLALRADRALKRAVAKVIEEHRRNGIPIAIWRDGKVVAIPPDPIMVREPQSEYIPTGEKSDSLPPLRGKGRMGGRKK
jgi:hypothetical protein